MNLLEFKRFCQLRQNWDYVFIKVKDSEFANIGPVVIERPEANEVIVKWNENFNIVPWTKVVDSIKLKLKSENTVNLVGNIDLKQSNSNNLKMDSFIQVSKLGLYVDNIVLVSCEKTPLTIKEYGEVKVDDSKNFQGFNDLNLENKVRLLIDDTKLFIGIVSGDLEINPEIRLKNSLKIEVISNNQNIIECRINNREPVIINNGNIAGNKLESIILNKDSNNIDSKTENDLSTNAGINVGRLATLYDYKDNTLYELNNYYGENTNLFNLKYYIIQ